MRDTAELNPTALRVSGHAGVGINVWDYGGAGPTLVLAHCTGTHGRIWDPIVRGLLDRFRIYAYDTRGHGDSDKPTDPEAYVWAHSGHDLLAVLDALDLTKDVRAAGHSAGASHICYAQMMRPGAFTKAVLIDPIIGPPEAFRRPNALAEKSRHRKNEFESLEAAKERFASKPPMKAWDAAMLEAYVCHGIEQRSDGVWALKCPGAIEAAVYEGSGASDVFERLHELELDVLLVTSDTSDVRSLAELQRERFRQAEYRILQGCSHFIPQERPAEIGQMIRDHLSS